MMLRFLIGAVTGFAAGLAVAMLTGGKSSDELRAEFERFRDEIQKRDRDALSGHLEARFKELQSGLEERLSAISDAASSMARDVAGKAQQKADDAGAAVKGAASDAADAVEDLAKDVA